MRYFYEKPKRYRSAYGASYQCNHPVYDTGTLFKNMEEKFSSCSAEILPEDKIYVLDGN